MSRIPIEQLSILATHRDHSLFSDDMVARYSELQERLCDKRVLVIGGAGSIGSATLQQLMVFYPRTLHVVDTNENNLTELVRDIRSRPNRLGIPDFRALPIDFGSPVMQRFLKEEDPYDYVLNFAALKHVRSEKDTYSLLQMLDTNILRVARLLVWLQERTGTRSYFCVSTDKAANPVNLMGASKRLMEHIIFSGAVAPGFSERITSARFANVAFSDGSLLHGWLKRLEKRQPLAVPRKTRRFFISLQEAGEICVLAAVYAPHRHLLIPKLNSADDLRDLQSIAEDFLQQNGFEPHLCENETEAKECLEADISREKYPLLLTPLDTFGEKSYEEFIGRGEDVIELGMSKLLGICYDTCDTTLLRGFLREAQEWVADPLCRLTKDKIAQAMAAVMPELVYRDSVKGLDERM